MGALKYLKKPVKAEDVKETLELALLKRKSRASVTLLLAGGNYADVRWTPSFILSSKDTASWYIFS